MATNPFSLENLAPTWVQATEILKGDFVGHPFRGNQWEPGNNLGLSEMTYTGSEKWKTVDPAQTYQVGFGRDDIGTTLTSKGDVGISIYVYDDWHDDMGQLNVLKSSELKWVLDGISGGEATCRSCETTSPLKDFTTPEVIAPTEKVVPASLVKGGCPHCAQETSIATVGQLLTAYTKNPTSKEIDDLTDAVHESMTGNYGGYDTMDEYRSSSGDY